MWGTARERESVGMIICWQTAKLASCRNSSLQFAESSHCECLVREYWARLYTDGSHRTDFFRSAPPFGVAGLFSKLLIGLACFLGVTSLWPCIAASMTIGWTLAFSIRMWRSWMLSLCGGAGNGAGGVHPCTALLGAPSLSLEPEPGVEAAVPRSENVLLPLPLLPLLLVPLRLPNDGLNFDRSVCVKPYFAMPFSSRS